MESYYVAQGNPTPTQPLDLKESHGSATLLAGAKGLDHFTQQPIYLSYFFFVA